jgi:heme/copper-type cytochrome/quinol oxidase subunit 2
MIQMPHFVYTIAYVVIGMIVLGLLILALLKMRNRNLR